MKITLCRTFVLLIVTIAAGAIAAAAQDGVQTRNILSDGYMRFRPAKSTSPPKKPFSYTYFKTYKNPVKRPAPKRPKPKPAGPAAAAKPSYTEIGVTMWKLRPPTETERGYFLPVLMDDKKTKEMWLAERVPADVVFSPGDKFRFAIESTVPGYLYVISRETFSDGTKGAPYAIFPEKPSDDNFVKPGMLFDYPDQQDEWPYLMLNAKKPNYSGEILTIIVSPKKLDFFNTDNDGNIKDNDEIAALEFNGESDIYSRSDQSDKIYTKVESDASCGIKTRQIEREKSSTPCGKSANLLSKDDPQPQFIYRVKSAAGEPKVAFLPLTVK